jgi:uncharacterized membrane protein YeiH
MRRPRLGLADLVLAADLGGTFLFAIEGSQIAAQAGLDLLGIVVIGFVAALGGGIIRDVLLGALPPAAIRDQRYPLLTIAGALIAILIATGINAPGLDAPGINAPGIDVARIAAMPAVLLTALDAAGLALFAVTGVQKALVRGLGPVGAVLMGTLTAVGGGAVRDVLLAQVPVILRTDFYATAAIIGCITILLARRTGCSMQFASLIGGLVCFAARLLGAFNQWHLPTLH